MSWRMDLDFDTNGSGDADAGDTYWNDGEGWAPLGLPEFEIFTTLIGAFRATFEGNGHSISNLFVNRGNFSGLFAGVERAGNVRNLNADQRGRDGQAEAVGGLIGDNRGIVSHVRTSGRVTGELHVGGLIGGNLRAVIRSSSSAAVMGIRPPTVFAPGQFVVIRFGLLPGTGGLVGYNTGFIVSSHATGPVVGDRNVGGLTGYNQSKLISGSYATGPVTGGSCVGGLVGVNGFPFEDPATIAASYATGSVKGSSCGGGLAGYNYGKISASYATGPCHWWGRAGR